MSVSELNITWISGRARAVKGWGIRVWSSSTSVCYSLLGHYPGRLQQGWSEGN